MTWILTKYLVTAAFVVLISEIAKRSDKFGALIASLPLVTILTLFWLHFEDQPQSKIANHAFYTFWYVLPTLPLFIAFPWMLARFGFWGAMAAGVVLTIACFLLTSVFARLAGVELFDWSR